MKKTLAIALVAVLALALVACGSTGIKDGTYTAQATEANYGWTESLSVTYKDGKVAEANYDAFDETGKLKSTCTPEEYPMDTPVSEWMPKLNANIVAAGTADKIEAVAGATNSSNNAKILMAAVEESAKAGKTDTVMVEMPAE